MEVQVLNQFKIRIKQAGPSGPAFLFSALELILDANFEVRDHVEMKNEFYERLVAHVNRKKWWHVPPIDSDAYGKRGKFYSVTFAAAEFWGRPLEMPERVTIARPLIGDEKRIARVLGIPPQVLGMSLKQIAAHDAQWRNAALKKGFDAIVLMAPKCFVEWRTNGKIPRSLELNILNVSGESKAPNRSLTKKLGSVINV